MAGQNYLSISPNSISLTYNKFNDTTSGDGLVNVIARHDVGGVAEQDSFSLSGDDDFNYDDTDFFTYFRVVVDPLNVPTIEGDYTYNVTVTGSASGIVKNLTVNLKIINVDVTPPEDFVYKSKYFIERLGNYRLDIFELVNPATILTPIEINGTVEFEYQNRKDLFDSIVASNLTLDLESSTDLNLETLYSEDEKQFKVILNRGGQDIFIGFIKPDGVDEDYTSDRWFLRIACIDGLSTLKNISFSNANGVVYTGKRSALSVIVDCLNKTALNLPININCNIFYEGFDFVQQVLDSVIINTERYFQNADEPMDCESVLGSILTLFNATVIQYNGEWWIFRTIDLKEDMLFSRYVGGLFVENFEFNPLDTVGSHINGAEKFFVSGNQRKSMGAGVQAYKISYQYGPANVVFSNAELKLNGSGLSMEGWTIVDVDGKVSRNENGYGISARTVDFNSNIPALLTLNQSIDIQVGASFNLSIDFKNDSTTFDDASSFGLRFGVAIGDMWLQESGEWSTTPSSIYIANSTGYFVTVGGNQFAVFDGKGNANYTAQIKAPKDGLLQIIIYRDSPPNPSQVVLNEGIFSINSIRLSGTNNGEIKGIDYTGQRTKRTSTVTKSDRTVFNGDSISDLFVGTIYKDDSDTPTSSWYREGRTENKELLAINAEDNLRMSPRPMLTFEGDIYGFIPFLSVVSIDAFAGKKFQFLNWSYSMDKNIIRMMLKEYSDDYLADEDFRVETRFNFGQTTKTTLLA